MANLADDDLLLVQRTSAGISTNYSITGSALKEDLGGPDGLITPPVAVLTPLNGAGLNDGQSYTPISSAYVSTDTTPIYYRYFPETFTTVSGGTWTDENEIFDGNNQHYATLNGAAGVVSQAVFTNIPSLSATGETQTWAYASGGGTIEVIDENDVVLRTYSMATAPQYPDRTDIGIVRVNNKIRYTTANTNDNLYIAKITLGAGAGETIVSPVDYVIPGRVAFEFTDDTDLDKMVAPIIQTDENGNVKVPTTSTVDSTTTIPGEEKGWDYAFVGNNSTKTIQMSSDGIAPTGERMLWIKNYYDRSSVIASNNLNGRFLTTSSSSAQMGNSTSIQLNDGSTVLNLDSSYNKNGYTSHAIEIGAAPKVLDIIRYTGTGTNLREIPHNLGCKPGMIIIKGVSGNSNWQVWHKDNNHNLSLWLNTSTYAVSGNYFLGEPTADNFYIGDEAHINAGGYDYVAYVFAADTPGKVKCGSYTGDGTGFRTVGGLGKEPGLVLIKSLFSTENWACHFPTMGSDSRYFEPNTENTFAGSSSYYIQTTSSYSGGFALHGGLCNNLGQKYAYIMIDRELTGPNSTQLNLLGGQDLEYFSDGTEITSNLAASGNNISFATHTYTGNGSNIIIQPYLSGYFFFDASYQSANKWLTWIKNTDYTYRHALLDSERNPQQALDTTLSYADNGGASEYYLRPNDTTGIVVGNGSRVNANGSNYISWNFLGSPQFFDVQKYIGNSGTNSIAHDLGVEPGCIIIKSISQDAHWWVYHSDVGRHQYLTLNRSVAASYSGNWISTTTDSHFVMNSSSSNVNTAGLDYISYIFAKDTPYVKCGSYTGSGGGTQVNVGFQPRWMLIKRTNADANWIILDKTEGNKYLEPNGNGGFGTKSWSFTTSGVNLIDGDNSVNGSGGSYIYVAIADEAEGHPPSPPINFL